MAGQFGTQTDVMTTAAQRIQDINQQIQGQLRTLQSQLAPLAGEWRGQGALSFQQTMERWNTDAARINTALGEIAVKVGEGARGYQGADEETRQAFNRLGGGGDAGPGAGATTPTAGGGLGQYL